MIKSFPRATGDMADRIRAYPWEGGSLGPIHSWPDNLNTLIGLMLASNQPMFLVWGTQQVLLYNDCYASVLRGHHPAALGRSFLQVWSEIADQLQPLVDAAYAGRPTHMDDIHLVMERNGGPEETHFAFSYTPVHAAAGKIDGFLCACLETTDQVSGIRAVNESKIRNRQIIDSAIDYAIVATDLDGLITTWNEGARRVLGWTEQEMIGEHIRCFFTPEDRVAERPELEMRTALETGRANDERWHLRKNGERFWANGEMNTLRDAADRPVGFVKVLRDQTDRLDAAEELRELNATLEERVAHEVEARMQIEEALRQSQKVEAIGQLTGGVAHDFNNLLTVIRGSVDLLRRPDVSDDRRARYIDAIADTADRATKLTGQLLAFARRQTLQAETFDAAAEVASLSDMLRTLSGPQIGVSIHQPERANLITTDRSQFDTAIVNIAVNARDAMQGEGALEIVVRHVDGVPPVRNHPAIPGAYVAVGITDSGSGIDAESIDRIFEPFYTTKNVGEGTGLGLSQVFGFVKQAGGEVVVESTEGTGATFTLYLPAADVAQGITERRSAPTSAASGDGACVLVVEDNVEVGRFATQALTELGYETVLAIDGASALAELASSHERFDVLFTDVVMPGMSGIELAQKVRRVYPDLPVVLASGYSKVLAEHGSHGFEFLRKPYSVDELGTALRSVRIARSVSEQND